MHLPRLHSVFLIATAALGLAGCSTYGGGYGRVSVGYGSAGYCDPYYDDCYGGGYGGYYGDPWYGWYGGYYYPGIGFYVYDRGGNRFRWSDDHRRYWEGRRQGWQGRNWNDRRWENWGSYHGANGNRDWNRGQAGGNGTWTRGSQGSGNGNWRRGGQSGGNGHWRRGGQSNGNGGRPRRGH
jgi:hypothetical protein